MNHLRAARDEIDRRHLQRRRIERAADRLRETDDPITRIALEVGFTVRHLVQPHGT